LYLVIFVSDDGSKPEHHEKLLSLQKVYPFRLITTPVNKGLGNNINKGQDAVNTPYTLYVQEDFDPFPGYKQHLQDALSIVNERPDIDMVRFYAYFKYPYLKPYRDGYSEMLFKLWYSGYRKFHCYSDHPHLRRSTFFKKFGRYAEGVKGDRTEF
jgi:glycosyltransferase involved in cell wall biosynthesis